jgi:hypothetical protein
VPLSGTLFLALQTKETAEKIFFRRTEKKLFFFLKWNPVATCFRSEARVARCSLFSNQRCQFGYILDGLWMKIFDVFRGNLVFLLPFGCFNDQLVFLCHISHFGLVYQEKPGIPVRGEEKKYFDLEQQE